MVRLHLLGSLGLCAGDGREIHSLLSQPWRTALLAYLAAARPRGFHRRDTLFALFWAESDTGRARNALNQAIHRLRQALGEGVLISRGDEEIGLNPEAFWCDAAAFEEALDRGDHEAALELYRGDLLPGFFVADAPELESWLERERAHLRARACAGALALAARREAEGEFREAAQWIRRALDLAPEDEATLRRLLRILDRIPERAAALRAYDDFAQRLEREYGLEPAPETRALVGEIRGRSEGAERPESTPSPRAYPGRAPEGEAGREERPIRSIAVLPFMDLSPDKDQEYLGDGIAEEVMGALARVPGLRVPGRTSAFAFRGKEAGVREIGWKLGVEAVLEGSIRASGGRLRIAAQLVGAADGFHIWNETYDRELKDALAVQEEIARSIVRAIQGRIEGGAPARAREENSEVYPLYLKGRYFKGKRSRAGLQKAIGYFRQVIDRDPSHARAHAALADAYQLQAFYGFAPIGAARGKARAAVKEALATDDRLAEAHASFASILSWEGDAAGAEREYRRAIELDPGYTQAHQWYASFLRHRNRLGEALREAEVALELDPLSMAVMLTIGSIYRALRHHDLAIEQYQRVLEMDPTYAPALYWLSGAYALTGQDDRAVATAEQAIAYGGEGSLYLGGLAFAQGLAGQAAEAERTLGRMERLAETEYISALDLVVANVGLRETDRALECLARACDEGDPSVRELLVDPMFDLLRPEPRFQSMLRRVRLVD
jgi:TolB-like protein/Tfp pilus assembly protein PilF